MEIFHGLALILVVVFMVWVLACLTLMYMTCRVITNGEKLKVADTILKKINIFQEQEIAELRRLFYSLLGKSPKEEYDYVDTISGWRAPDDDSSLS
jgi:hypothetical protein